MGKKSLLASFNPANMNPIDYSHPAAGFGSSGTTVGGPGSGSMSIISPYGANNAFYGMPSTNGGTVGGGSLGMNPGGAGAGGGGGPTDPYGTAAMGFLQDTLSGKAAPFDDATKSAMLGKASDMSAAAEGARNSNARDAVAGGGADMSDPSARAFTNESMARRQSDNIGAAQGIDAQANVANFGAKTDAANTLANFSRADAQRRASYLASLGGGNGDVNHQNLGFNPYGSGGSTYRVQGSNRVTGYGQTGINQPQPQWMQ